MEGKKQSIILWYLENFFLGSSILISILNLSFSLSLQNQDQNQKPVFLALANFCSVNAPILGCQKSAYKLPENLIVSSYKLIQATSKKTGPPVIVVIDIGND